MEEIFSLSKGGVAGSGAPGKDFRGENVIRRMRRTLELLGDPQNDYKIVHIAGTNGKGSVAAFTASILKSAGKMTGLFTSPHVMRYSERFTIDGVQISDDDFIKTAECVLTLNDTLEKEGYGRLSPFDALTAVAYKYFSDAGAEYAVIEVGLGGRFDPTNAIERPAVTVVTDIGLDHTDRLGHDIKLIAAEKAGIIKAGAPVISQPSDPEVKKVIEEHAKEACAHFIDTSSVPVTVAPPKERSKTVFDAEISGRRLRGLEISLLGRHQVKNAVSAVAAVLALPDDEITEEAIREGLSKAVNPGRFQIISEKPYIILDGAHNPPGVRAAMETLTDRFGDIICDSDISFVIGCFRDKEYEKMAEIFAEAIKEIKGRCGAAGRSHGIKVIATEPDDGRKLPAETLKEVLERCGVGAEAARDWRDAFYGARENASEIVLFLGSIYFIGDILRFFKEKREESL